MASKLPFLHFPVTPSPETKRSHFISRQNIVTTSTSNPTRQTFLLANTKISFLSPVIKVNNPSCPIRSMSTVRSNLNLNFPLISPTDQWGTWTVLLVTGALGIWSERTKIGRALSSASVSTLLGLAASNLGIISHESPAYSIVLNFLFPLTVPLLLFRADLDRVIKSTWTLLLPFLLGSAATIVGTKLGYIMVPMRALSNMDSWMVAIALMGGRMGGAFNYISILTVLEASPSVLAAGLAAYNVSSAVYFAALFALASKIPSHESSTSTNDLAMLGGGSESVNKLPVLHTATALAVSVTICKLADSTVTKLTGVSVLNLPVITVFAVFLSTVSSKYSIHLAPSAEALAMFLMQVFFVVFGARGNIWNVINTAPSIFIFSLAQITIHLALILGFGKLLGFDQKLLLIASSANIGGPATACGMAASKGWNSLVAPAIFSAYFGILIVSIPVSAWALGKKNFFPPWFFLILFPFMLYEKLLQLLTWKIR